MHPGKLHPWNLTWFTWKEVPGSLEIPNLETIMTSGSMLNFGGVTTCSNDSYRNTVLVTSARYKMYKINKINKKRLPEIGIFTLSFAAFFFAFWKGLQYPFWWNFGNTFFWDPSFRDPKTSTQNQPLWKKGSHFSTRNCRLIQIPLFLESTNKLPKIS